MLSGAGLFDDKPGGLWKTKGGQSTQPMPAIPGFSGTSIAQHSFIRTERYQVTPPSDLGRVAAFDREFAEAIGDYTPTPQEDREDPRGPWMPMWASKEMVEGRKEQQYEWDYLTPHGAVEDVLLYRYGGSRAPNAQAYTIPTSHPAPAKKIAVGVPRLWK